MDEENLDILTDEEANNFEAEVEELEEMEEIENG